MASMLGALVTHAAIATSDLIRARYTGLADASALVGSHATRANGTIGGNVMNASPAMDTGAPLLCLGAQAELIGPGGTRLVDLADLWTGPGTTQRPTRRASRVDSHTHPAAGTGTSYVRLQYRRQMEIAVVGAGVAVTLLDGMVTRGRCGHRRAGPHYPSSGGGRGRTGRHRWQPGCGEAAANAAAAAARPIDDVRASADYRRAMAAVITRPRHPGRPGPGPGRDRGRPCQRIHLSETDMTYPITLEVNGVHYPLTVDAHASLLHTVRDQVGLTGSKEGCDDSECGACMMLIDGRPVNSCSYLGGPGRWQSDHDRGRAYHRSGPHPPAGGLSHRRSRAMRILHARHARSRPHRYSPPTPIRPTMKSESLSRETCAAAPDTTESCEQ